MMAPVNEFRHVELDKVGRGKRVLKPPGGGCSDIFGSQTPSPQNGTDQRRVRNHQQSQIFSPEAGATNGHPASPTTPTNNGRRLSDGNTQDRLFGTPIGETTPTRKTVDRMKSSIFSEEVDSPPSRPNSVKKTPYVRRNPITGEICEDVSSPTNGHTNGNGTDAGNPITGAGARDNGTPAPQPCVRIRNPPGGQSSGIF